MSTAAHSITILKFKLFVIGDRPSIWRVAVHGPELGTGFPKHRSRALDDIDLDIYEELQAEAAFAYNADLDKFYGTG